MMKTLKEYIIEGILDIEDNIENASKIVLAETWLNEWRHYIKNGKVNSDGTINAKSVELYNLADFEIPEYIQFNEVEFFKVMNCQFITNCHGFPIKCENVMIYDNASLSSLEGFHKNTYYERLFISDDHDRIMKLNGLPPVKQLELIRLRRIDSLEGLSDCEELKIENCKSLKSLKGISKNIKKLQLLGCRSLKNLSAISKKKLKRLYIWMCKGLSEEYVKQFLDNDGILYYERILNYDEWNS